jgi:methylated-DNA-protein-cysteine methyltransferase-like protein
MRQLLEGEGIRIDENQILDFQRVFWDPVKELDDTGLPYPGND